MFGLFKKSENRDRIIKLKYIKDSTDAFLALDILLERYPEIVEKINKIRGR